MVISDVKVFILGDYIKCLYRRARAQPNMNASIVWGGGGVGLNDPSGCGRRAAHTVCTTKNVGFTPGVI